MITQAYMNFFTELAANNHKDWFQENKKRYDKEVKAPFLSLMEEIILEIRSFDDQISTDPKAALFRINRDIRFSKDKTPYNTLMKAGIAPGGKKSALPGYYLGISAHIVYVGGGLFGVDKDQLRNIRSTIANDFEQFAAIINDPDFIHRFGALKGEQAKRLEPNFKAIIEKAPFIANKQFYAMSELPLADLLGADELKQTIVQYFKCVYPLNNYLKETLM